VPILVCKMKQGGAENSLFGRLPADRRLRSYRSGPPVSLDLTCIAIPRQRCEFLSRRGTEQTLERPSRCLCQLPNSKHADLGQTRAPRRISVDKARHQSSRRSNRTEAARRSRLPRVPTRLELARAALGIIFCSAALVIGWLEVFWRHRL
jgi:hypothetical protein